MFISLTLYETGLASCGFWFFCWYVLERKIWYKMQVYFYYQINAITVNIGTQIFFWNKKVESITLERVDANAMFSLVVGLRWPSGLEGRVSLSRSWMRKVVRSNPSEGNSFFFCGVDRVELRFEEQEEVRINPLQFGLNMAPSTYCMCNIVCVIKRNIDLRWSEKETSHYGRSTFSKKKKKCSFWSIFFFLSGYLIIQFYWKPGMIN